MMVFFSKQRSSMAAHLMTKVVVVLLGVVCFIAPVQPVAAIYPDDHWQYATALTTETFEDFIQDAINDGKTAFVRWIASPG
jgi:hypothetical protein